MIPNINIVNHILNNIVNHTTLVRSMRMLVNHNSYSLPMLTNDSPDFFDQTARQVRESGQLPSLKVLQYLGVFVKGPWTQRMMAK